MAFWALFHTPSKRFGRHCHSDHREPRHPVRALSDCLLTILCILAFLSVASAQSPPSRPILFVHGWCGSPYDWATLFSYLLPTVPASSPLPTTMYPDQTVYLAQYNSTTGAVLFWSENNASEGANGGLSLLPVTVPPDARFFVIQFYDSNPQSTNPTDPTNVARISVLNKADELSNVIKAIIGITGIRDVNIVAHSMGGLVARAYAESMASSGVCYNYAENATDYYADTCSPGTGSDAYRGDVANIITLDTPNNGSPLANSWGAELAGLGFTCNSTTTTNSSELVPDSPLLTTLNYGGTGLGYGNTLPHSLTTPIQALVDYDSNLTLSWTFLSGYSDDIVQTSSQSIEQNVSASDDSFAIKDYNLGYPGNDFAAIGGCNVAPSLPDLGSPMIHLLSCLGAFAPTQQQLTNLLINDTVPWVASWNVTPSAVSLGGTVTIQYSAQDLSSSTLSTAELWRALWNFGQPMTWEKVSSQSLSGDSPQQITFTDTPPAAGIYIYGTHLFDSAGNEAFEPYTSSVTVNPTTQSPTVTVQAAPTHATLGTAVTLTGTVTSSVGTPTGSITFYDGTAAISSAIALNNTGSAVFVDSGLMAGAHSISAKYSGSSSFPEAASSPVTVTIGTVAPQSEVSPQSGTIGVTVFTKSGSGFTPNGPITHTATWPDNTKSVLNGYADSTGSFSYTVAYSGEAGTYYQTDTDNTTGKTSNTISWTVSPVAMNDFSLSPSPGSETINQGGTATFSLTTATISGSTQSISLSYSNAPSGMSVSFSQSAIASGGSVTFTVSAGSTVAAGTYLLTITGTGTSATHSSSVSVTVVQQQSGSEGSLASSPASFNFNPQTVDTASSPVEFSIVNSGGAAVTISSLTASPGFIPSFLNGLGIPITLQPNGGYANMQVVFIPTSAGTQTGTINLFNSTNASPLTISLSGSGVGAPATGGNIQVNATFNGSPWSGNLYTSLSGPESYTDGQAPITHSELAPGGYTEAYSAGGPGGATLESITPSASQTLTAGSTITFTYNFTGTNTFSIGDPQPITTVMGTGESATIQLPQMCLETGAAQTIQFAMQGLPSGAGVVWSANPLSLSGCGQDEPATITTSAMTPPGVYSVQITGTNQGGSSSTTSAWLSVNLPPASPDALVSIASNGTQGNGNSGGSVISGSTNEYDPVSVSADGHVIAFTSSATNLVSQNVGGLLVRDTNAGTTILGSAAADGTPATGAFPSLSADGTILVFASSSSTLPNPATYGSTQGVYVRDLSAGTVTRIDMAPDGTPGNGISSYSSISADGRFVAFQSSASNLLPGASSGGVFVYDRKAGAMKLASVSSDGSIQAYGELPRISASGRYVLFASSNPSLVPNDTNGTTDAFVHDFVTGQTTRVNVASDGTEDTCGIITTISSPLAISADGRYVAFESCGDLVQGYADPRGDGGDVYIHDMVTGQTSPLGIDQVGDLLNTQTVGGFSADGRFVAVNGSIIDQTTGEMTRVDVLSDGSGSPAVTNTSFYGGDTTTAFLSSDGSHSVFASNASNLVPNDNNGYFDVFEGVNPFLASPRLTSITLSANQAPGGTSVTGTLTLNAPAPAGGAAVSVWTDNDSVSVQGIVSIPEGASSAPFSITTSEVPAEAVVAVLASYDSGSSVAVLAVEPAAVLVTSPPSWNFGSVAVGTKGTAESFVLSNSGTASLAIGSIQMATGQAFTISANTCGSSITPGGSCSISVAFAPSTVGAASDSVQIAYGSPATTQAISLSGEGAMPVAVLAPLPLSFGNQLMPGSTVGTATLSNSGSANLSNISTAISGSNAGDFMISADGCTGVILPANSSCSVSVTFSPKAKGSRAATLSITDNASGSPQTASLTGVGVQSTPAILWAPSTVSLTYGTALGGVLNASAQGNGSNLAGTFAYTATIGGGTPQTVSQTTVLTAGAYTITAAFTPTDSVDYTTSTASISITVATATPVVAVVPGASSISATQPLAVTVTVGGGIGNPTPTGSVIVTSGSYASATATLNAGTATINIPASTLAAGNYTFKASYTPDPNSSSEYGGASGTASSSVTVTAATSTLTLTPGASSITTTQALPVTVTVNGGSGNLTPTGTVTLTSDNYTSAVTSLSNGSATINIPADALAVGSDTLSVAYSGNSIYAGNTGTGSVVVTLSTASVTVTPGNNGSFDSSQAESVTVTVAGAGPAPTGTATLSGGGYTSPSTALSSGAATFSIPASQFTAAGSIMLTANYSGDGVYASGSGTGSINVNAPYSVSATTPSEVNPGSSATATVTLTADSSYSGTVTLTCALTSSPTGAQDLPTCTVTSGSSITVTNGTASGSTTVTLSTTATNSASLDRHGIPGWTGAGGGMVLALLVFLGIPARRRRWSNLLGLVVVMAVVGTLSACGGGGGGAGIGGGGGSPGTTAGDYTFTVTATGNPGVTPAPSAIVKLTVN